MPEINNVVVYDAGLIALIDSKIRQIGCGFEYNNWGDDDLALLRKTVRDFYKREQNGYCAYCRREVSMVSVLNCHVEHIVPKSLHIDFIFHPKNLCVICADCNQIKKDQETLNEIPDTLTLSNGKVRKRYPTVSGGFKIVHPHFDNYKDHIVVFGEYYVDRTAKGHFTIGACKLNRRLYELGWQEVFHSDTSIIEIMTSFMDSDSSVERINMLKKLKKALAEIDI